MTLLMTLFWCFKREQISHIILLFPLSTQKKLMPASCSALVFLCQEYLEQIFKFAAFSQCTSRCSSSDVSKLYSMEKCFIVRFVNSSEDLFRFFERILSELKLILSTKNELFLLRFSSVNVTKSQVSCGFDHIY